MAKQKNKTSNREGRTKSFHSDWKDQSFSVRLRILENSLTQTEKKVGKYFLSNTDAVYLSITEVVEDSSLGYGTIMRFCQKLGCSGFQEFKVLLAQEMALPKAGDSFDETDRVFRYGKKIAAELANTEKLIDHRVLLKVADVLNEAKRVLVTGIAGSASLAVGFDYRLNRLGINAVVICDGYNLAIRAASLDAKDVFFAISFSGATKDILSAAKVAKGRKAIIISLTNFIHAPLVDLANYGLFSSTDRDPMSCEIFSNISSDFVLDVLFSQLYRIRKDAKKIVKRTFAAISDRRV
ncbi:HTH-type transcriptional regulator MurR [subsurface metagenome]